MGEKIMMKEENERNEGSLRKTLKKMSVMTLIKEENEEKGKMEAEW